MSKFPFSQRNLVSRLHVYSVLRSVRNLHHRKDLLLTSRFEYKLDMFWIRGFGVIGYQSPKMLTLDLAEPRDPPVPRDPRYELTPEPDVHVSRQSARDPLGGPPRGTYRGAPRAP